jgi:hypothetical protein
MFVSLMLGQPKGALGQLSSSLHMIAVLTLSVAASRMAVMKEVDAVAAIMLLRNCQSPQIAACYTG